MTSSELYSKAALNEKIIFSQTFIVGLFTVWLATYKSQINFSDDVNRMLKVH